jgi:hypothetical protein
MVSENTRPTSQHSVGLERYGASNWGIIFGLVAAVLIGGMLYFSFSGDLIDERSTAFPSPPAASAPVDSGPATSTQPSVPSTK